LSGSENRQVRMAYLGRRTRVAFRISIGVFFILLTTLGFTSGLPTTPIIES